MNAQKTFIFIIKIINKSSKHKIKTLCSNQFNESKNSHKFKVFMSKKKMCCNLLQNSIECDDSKQKRRKTN